MLAGWREYTSLLCCALPGQAPNHNVSLTLFIAFMISLAYFMCVVVPSVFRHFIIIIGCVTGFIDMIRMSRYGCLLCLPSVFGVCTDHHLIIININFFR